MNGAWCELWSTQAAHVGDIFDLVVAEGQHMEIGEGVEALDLCDGVVEQGDVGELHSQGSQRKLAQQKTLVSQAQSYQKSVTLSMMLRAANCFLIH